MQFLKPNIFLLIGSFFLFVSCNTTEQKKEEAEFCDPVEKAEEPKQKWKDTSADFSIFYKGKINGKLDIEMYLHKAGEYFRGAYKYKTQQSYLNLEGQIDSTGKIRLKEFDNNNRETGWFFGYIKGDRFTGEWSMPEGHPSYKFELEKYEGKNFFEADGSAISKINFIKDTFEIGISKLHVNFPGYSRIENMINNKIDKLDTCIVFYDYYLHKNYLQVLNVYGCYKFLQYQYFLIDVRTGNLIKGIELIRPDKRSKVLADINKKMKEIYDEQNSGDCRGGAPRPEDIKWTDIEITINKTGIGFEYNYGYAMASQSCENGHYFLKWEAVED